MCARPRGGRPQLPSNAADLAADHTLPGCDLNPDDYTYYVSAQYEVTEDHDRGLLGLPHWRDHDHLLRTEGSGSCYSAACTRHIFRRDNALPLNVSRESYTVGRMLACRCFAGEAIAVTVRALSHQGTAAPRKRTSDPTVPKTDPETDYSSSPHKTDLPFPIPIKTILDKFEDLKLFSDPTGLVLVTGSTHSGKSELTRALVQRYIGDKRKAGGSRWPHLVTFEDPIEKRLFNNPQEALAHGIEYTPRQKGIDAGSLKEALEDALRQTPAVYYVGEIREDSDWADVLRFAGTGHLIVATAHAGSLVEAMERIFRGVNARTAAERGQVAQKIQAVIHQRIIPIEEISGFRVLLPALWRRTPSGIAALVGDGLSSILPNNPKEEDQIRRTSSFGRQWFLPQGDDPPPEWRRIQLAKLLGKKLAKELADEEDGAKSDLVKKIEADLESSLNAWNWLREQKKWAIRLGYALARSSSPTPSDRIDTKQAIQELCEYYSEEAKKRESSGSEETKKRESSGTPEKKAIEDLANVLDEKLKHLTSPDSTYVSEANKEATTALREVRANTIRYDLGGV